jgi:hypothetical protein
VIRICGWCDRFLGLTSPEHLLTVTHGICAPCEAAARGLPVTRVEPPPGRYLLIVAADAPELAAAVRARVAPWAEYLTVVTDRRGREPGRLAGGQDQRRGPPAKVQGVVAVACGPATGALVAS